MYLSISDYIIEEIKKKKCNYYNNRSFSNVFYCISNVKHQQFHAVRSVPGYS